MRFLTLQDIPAVGGGVAFPANCEFNPYEIGLHYDKFLQAFVYLEGTKRRVILGDFKVGIHYRKLNYGE